MTSKEIFSKLNFKKEIPDREVVLKFIPTDPGLGFWNDILLLVNRSYVDQKNLEELLKNEFNKISQDPLPEEFDTEKEFFDLQLREEFVEFLAISLIAHTSLPKDLKSEIKKGTYFNQEGVLLVVLDKKKLQLKDYFAAVREFLKKTKINLKESNVYIQVLPALTEVEC